MPEFASPPQGPQRPNEEAPPACILLTGASGYVGGRLLGALADGSTRVRCMTRRPEFLHAGTENVEVVHGDVLEPDSLKQALDGTTTAYYLVHSMAAGHNFSEEDRIGARNFGAAACAAGVQRIIYLGGLGKADAELSHHLKSRQEVGEILRTSGVPTLEFRASVVIGSGSLSFELIRSLVECLPMMVTPRWVACMTQPIAIEDLIAYLVQAHRIELPESCVVQIGGPDLVSYGGLMREYAAQRGLKRVMVPVPLLIPRLSSLWLGLVTPVYARVGRMLIDGVRNPTVVTDESASERFDIRPMTVREAIGRALRNEDRDGAETRWSDALSAGVGKRSWAGIRFGNRLVYTQTARVDVPPEVDFTPIRRIGGNNG